MTDRFGHREGRQRELLDEEHSAAMEHARATAATWRTAVSQNSPNQDALLAAYERALARLEAAQTAISEAME